MDLFSPFFIFIENSDGINISGDFKRYFKSESCSILPTFFYGVTFIQITRKEYSAALLGYNVLYSLGKMSYCFIKATLALVLLHLGAMYLVFLFQVIVCHQVNISLLELHHRVYFLHISLVLHLVHKVQRDDWQGVYQRCF